MFMDPSLFDVSLYLNGDPVPEHGERIGVYDRATNTFGNEFWHDYNNDGAVDEIDYESYLGPLFDHQIHIF